MKENILDIPYADRKTFFKLPLAGDVYDVNSNLLGRWICLQYSYQQADLDKLCRSWLETYEDDPRFFLTVDFETTGLDPHTCEVVLAAISWDENHSVVVVVDNFDLTLLKEVFRKVKISNQNVKFDSKFSLGRFGVEFNIYFDVLTAAQIAYSGKINKFNLGALSRELLNIQLEKEESKETTLDFTKMAKVEVGGQYFWFGKTLKDRRLQDFHIEYAAQDTIIAHRLVKVIINQLIQDDLYNVWREMELPLVRYYVGLELKGIPIDKTVAQESYNNLEEELLQIKKSLAKSVSSLPLTEEHKAKLIKLNGELTINPMSSIQITETARQAGMKLKNTVRDHLSWHVLNEKDPKVKEFISLVNDYRTKSTELTKYLKPWLTHLCNPKTGRIHPTIKVVASNGATGRSAASDPNVMAVKPSLRPVIIARPGFKIATLDYSQLEMRAGAGFAQEPTLLEAFFKRAELLPEIEVLSTSKGIIDPDTFVKDIVAGKDFKLTPGEIELTHKFSNTDVHKKVASIVYDKPTWEISGSERTICKCVSLETIVYTDKGLFKLRDLLPKRLKPDTFYNLKKKFKVLSDTNYQEVGKVYYSGKQKALKITTDSGRSITCSLNHKFRVVQIDNYNWVEAQHLSVGESLVVKLEPKKNCWNLEGFAYGWYHYCVTKNDAKVDKDGKAIVLPNEKFKEYLISKKIPFTQYKLGYKVDSKHFANFSNKANPFWWHSFANAWSFNHKGHVLCKDYGDFADYIFHAMSYLGYNITRPNETMLTCTWSSNAQYNKKYCFTEETRKSMRKEYLHGVLSIDDDDAIYDNLKPVEKFMLDNYLKYDKIVSIESCEAELGDLEVPANNTLVYNGFVSHNTINYLAFYGGQAQKLQETLMKAGVYFDLASCEQILKKYFAAMPNLLQYLKSLHKQVLDPGYIVTPLGRKKFFTLPPKWMASYYREKYAEACREAGNAAQQCANVDCLKLASAEIIEYLKQQNEEKRGTLYFTIHDEIVTEFHESTLQDDVEKKKEIMVRWGSEATNNLVPIEVSVKIEDHWAK